MAKKGNDETVQKGELAVAKAVLRSKNLIILAVIIAGGLIVYLIKDVGAVTAYFTLLGIILGIESKLSNVIEKRIFDVESQDKKG